MNDAVILGLVGALGGLATLAVQRWKARGEWTDRELSDIRQDLRVRIKELEDRLEERETEMLACKELLYRLQARVYELEREMRQLHGEAP